MERVEDAHGQRGQGNEKQIRKNNPVQVHGQVLSDVRARKQLHDRRRKDHAQNGYDRRHQGQRPEQAISEVPDFLFLFFLHVARKDRDEGGGHGAFGDQSTKQVGNAVG
jgi:hypothetical protein